MPFSAEVKKKYLLLRHEGEVTPQESDEARAEVLRLVKTSGLTRIVIDLRDATADASTEDLRTFMQGNEQVKPPRPHAALLVREDQHPRFRFIEDFAVSRGMPIRVFVDENEAMSWLED